MIKALINWSIQNRFMVIVLTVIVSGWGIYAVKNIPLDAIPDLSDCLLYTSPSPRDKIHDLVIRLML